MANREKEIHMEDNEILRVSVRKKYPNADEYEYEICFDMDDKDAVRLSEIFETTLKQEIDLSFLLKVLEKAVEEGVDISSILEEDNN